MPSTEVEVQDTEATEAEVKDPGVPTELPGPYTGVEVDETSGGIGWWNDPLYPGNDVQPNAEWLESVTPTEEDTPEAQRRAEEENRTGKPKPVDANEDV